MADQLSNLPPVLGRVPWNPTQPQKWREEAFRAVEGIGERHFTTESLEGCIRDFAGYIVALVEQNALLSDVAHRAFHLLDEGGETADDPTEFVAMLRDAEQVSAALDRLEASGWTAHSGETRALVDPHRRPGADEDHDGQDQYGDQR